MESETVEYKREYTDDIRKTVVAFANTSGGEIHIGVSARIRQRNRLILE